MGGGSAADVQEAIEEDAEASLATFCDGPIGGAVRTGEDDLFRFGPASTPRQLGVRGICHALIVGDRVRDWAIAAEEVSIPSAS